MTDYLDITQLCRRYGFNRRTVYQWVALDQIPFCKAGRCLRFASDEIERWLRAHRAEEQREDSGRRGKHNSDRRASAQD
jgi:excisionase family DNA binding protein